MNQGLRTVSLAGAALLASASLSASGHAAGAPRNGMFAFDDQTANQTFVIEPRQRGQHLLIQFGVMPAWSPDGKQLAYVGSYLDPKVDNYEPRLYVMNANGSQRHRLPVMLGVSYPTWSPDGKEIAFVGGDGSAGPPVTGSIYVVNVDGSRLQRLTTSDSDKNPIWSPDGKTIAYETWKNANASDEIGDIVLMNADGTSPRKIAIGVEVFSNISWSPAGTKIAYLGRQLSGIFTMNPDGSDRHEISAAVASSLAWSPDGREIAFEGGQRWSRSLGIYMVNADGSAARQVNRLDESWDYGMTLSWQPRP